VQEERGEKRALTRNEENNNNKKRTSQKTKLTVPQM
jgi:hypothetical protein